MITKITILLVNFFVITFAVRVRNNNDNNSPSTTPKIDEL